MAAASSVEAEFLAARTIAAGYHTGIHRLRAGLDPGLDCECRVISERAEIYALNVANIAVAWGQYAETRGEIRVIRMITELSETYVEKLAVMAAPRIVC